jgi:glycosyltransferase involved in cell wall biosynthesis
MIDAMPSILKRRADAMYVVLGATHPNLVRTQGEAYRESLVARARELGVEDHVAFLDQFVDHATLLDFISMCDVYVTPYLNESQMTSGTLSYSFGLGKGVVSTPYWHAQELLGDGRGILVPFDDAAASSRSMTWERSAERYLATFESVRRRHQLRVIARLAQSIPSISSQAPAEMQIGH